MLQPNFNPITSTKKVFHEVKVNAESPIKAEDEIKKPVSVKADVFVTSLEKGEAETLVKAQVAFGFVYLAEEGYKKAESNVEITAKIPLQDPIVNVSVEDARVIFYENGYTAKASVTVRGIADANKNYSALSGGEDIYIKEGQLVFDSATGKSTDTLTVEDEFEVGYAVSEVLMHRESVTLKEITSGISAVNFEGEVNLALSLLPFSENSDILKEVRKIPFRFEMENVGALPTMRACGAAEIKKVAVKVVADEAKAKSVVTVEIVLGFTGEAMDETAVSIAEDAYSVSHFLLLKRETVDYRKFIGQNTYGERLSEATDTKTLDGGRLITALGERINVFSAVSDKGRIKITGTVSSDVIFKNADNGTTVQKAEAPFDIDCEVTGEAVIGRVYLTDFNVREQNGNVEFDFAINCEYALYEDLKANIVTEVTESGEREQNGSAITVYLPSGGDELWDVAKTLGESEENIVKYNPDLTFPLRAEDRVIIYRQKQ